MSLCLPAGTAARLCRPVALVVRTVEPSASAHRALGGVLLFLQGRNAVRRRVYAWRAAAPQGRAGRLALFDLRRMRERLRPQGQGSPLEGLTRRARAGLTTVFAARPLRGKSKKAIRPRVGPR